MGVAMFIAVLDVQIVATSLTTIQDALDLFPDQISWIQTAYLIAEVIAIPLTGLLIRGLSMRGLFVVAVTLFTFSSVGCAGSDSFETLIVWRALQGFFGGTLIPIAFTAGLILFPSRLQGPASTVAGVLAVLAPTVGPIVGGWITTTFSWHWLFLINVVPGFLCAVAGTMLVPADKADAGELRRLDVLSLILMAVALAALEIGLKDAPQHGWISLRVGSLLAVAAVGLALFAYRTLGAKHPVVELRTLRDDKNFAVGCALSFLLGVGIFGSVYLMPVFLGFVREHTALEIGKIVFVTGVAQIIAAPIVVALERRIDARILSAIAFLGLAVGLYLSAFQTEETDFGVMFWPQVIRGAAIMFALIAPLRIALTHLPAPQVPDASGLFNLMRNLGGAIGIALADTVIYGRIPAYVSDIAARLKAGDVTMAREVGIPVDTFLQRLHTQLDDVEQAALKHLIEKLALTHVINEAWLMLAGVSLLALVLIPFADYKRGDY
ncbi:MAG: DHA2 family efflux MFS transporter permease subunit [Alphaproteobacteria bacterium]|nr:DHA2 family efflux MFS transporter permease subunit [Alphaproteobacteria bacterium]